MKKALLTTIAVLALALCVCAGAAAASGTGTLTVNFHFNVPGVTVTDMNGESQYTGSSYDYSKTYHSGTSPQYSAKEGYFTFTKTGYQTQTFYLSDGMIPGEGQTNVVDRYITLAENPYGKIYITSSPNDATIKIDGSYAGTTPATVSVPAGTHTVTVSKNGYTTASSNVRVYAGETATVSISLGSSSGYISISCDPAGASVYLDEEFVGTAPLTIQASSGKHTVQLKKSGYGSFSTSVYVKPGETSTVFGVLPAGSGSGYFSIGSSPSGASVYVDGEYIGKTPYSSVSEAYLSAGPYQTSRTYTIELKLDGYNTYTTTAVPNSDRTVVIYPTLTKAEAKTGTLHVTSSPSGASVTVDGVYYGTSPVTVPNLAAGSHQVKVSAAGYVESVQSVQINAGQYVEYPVTLYTPSPSPAQSPAPVLGVLIGLAAAGLYAGLRRRQ